MSDLAICIIGVILLAFTWLALRGMVSEEKRRRTLPRSEETGGSSSMSPGPRRPHEAAR